MTTTSVAPMLHAHAGGVATRPVVRHIPLARLVHVEIRKMLDTRAGAWLLAGTGLCALPAAGAVIAWAPDEQLTDHRFTLAIGCPMSVILPVGFTLGALIRNSPGAVVASMGYAFVIPGLLAFLAFNQAWFTDARPWLDPKYHQDALIDGSIAGDQWTPFVVTTAVWLVLPLAAAVVALRRSEVK
jgi:hypothetical protein